MPSQDHETLICSHCLGALVISGQYPKRPLRYCVYCGVSIPTSEQGSETQTSFASSDWGASLITGQSPQEEPVQFTLGPYQILRKIGEGGMGEVFLAYDPACGRRIALKKIRSDLKEQKILYNRFLKEARITSQLYHPAIIPIFTIARDGELLYYTMPYIEGKTLKQLLREARRLEQQGGQKQEASIPFLIRIFLSICQAIAYAHSKGVFHRDIKPENVIVGRYGEAKILDWGLADLAQVEDEVPIVQPRSSSMTRMGKVVGTLSYMAPERALGGPATVQTEIYALGVVLYQLLTLTLPFRRKSLSSFREKGEEAPLKDPIEVAPYRDIPKALAKMAEKCLEVDSKKRFQRVQDLIFELEGFIEGRSEWFEAKCLSPERESDWEFQENVLIADFSAISRHPEETRWVNMMVSEANFSGNVRLETELTIHEGGEGVGLLFSIKEREERLHLLDGYCFWLSALPGTPSRLIRSGIDVIEAPDLILTVDLPYRVTIEKVDESVHLFLDGKRVLSYITHLPQEGSHIGIMRRDTLLKLEELKVFEAGQNALVRCHAVPDAFLAHKEYGRALIEYRRIGHSFPGRAEGREALFRAGITLLEQGKEAKEPHLREEIFQLAFEEFEKLRQTPGAPLEYLGKALINEATSDYEEEAKCFDIAWRRTPKHPLLPLLEEHLLFRAQESARIDRLATYQFSLLLLRHSPERTLQEGKRLLDRLQKNTETPWFLEPAPRQELLSLGIELSYHLSKGHLIEEFLKIDPSPSLEKRALYLLLDMGHPPDALTPASKALYQELSELRPPKGKDKAPLFWLAKRHLYLEKPEQCLELLERLPSHLTPEEKEKKRALKVLALFLLGAFEEGGKLLETLLVEKLSEERSPLFFPYGCWLLRSEGKEIASIHFQALLEANFPSSSTIGAHLYAGKLDRARWSKQAFFWEKRELAFQMMLIGKFSQERSLYEEWKEELHAILSPPLL